MTKKIYLETLKSVLGRSIIHYYINIKFHPNNFSVFYPALAWITIKKTVFFRTVVLPFHVA